MVGNVWEWVAEWTAWATNCTTWPSAYGADDSCVGGPGGAGDLSLPGARHRGGSAGSTTGAGVFSISDGRANLGWGSPSYADSALGFRCAR